MKYTSIHIVQDGIISGFMRGGISFTINRPHRYCRSVVHGEAAELIIPSYLEKIYDSGVDNPLTFDIIIRDNDDIKVVLKDIYIWPCPQAVYRTKKVTLVQNFKFHSWC